MCFLAAHSAHAENERETKMKKTRATLLVLRVAFLVYKEHAVQNLNFVILVRFRVPNCDAQLQKALKTRTATYLDFEKPALKSANGVNIRQFMECHERVFIKITLF